jgi:hypothetical protein
MQRENASSLRESGSVGLIDIKICHAFFGRIPQHIRHGRRIRYQLRVLPPSQIGRAHV